MSRMKRKRAASATSSGKIPAVSIILHGESCAVLDRLSAFRKEGTLTDVTVTAGGESFPAHRNVLAASSDYFGALFQSGMRDSQAEIVTLGDMSSTIVAAVLSFVYDGRCEVEAGTLCTLLEASVQLQVPALQAVALESVTSHMRSEDALSLWALGDRLALPTLVAAATEAAIVNFGTVIASDSLLEATHAQLCAMLESADMEFDDEEAVFRAVVRWHAAAAPTEVELVQVLKLVRFGLMTADFLQQVVRSWPPMSTGLATNVLLDAMQTLCPGGQAPRPRCRSIVWQTFSENMTKVESEDGVVFTRENGGHWDVALGDMPITSGKLQWTVSEIGVHAAVGVATWDCNRKDIGYEGSWVVQSVGRADLYIYRGHFGIAIEEILDSQLPLEGNDNIRTLSVLLDMDARTLSIRINGGLPILVLSNLPASVHPCLYGGNDGTNFRVVVDPRRARG